MKVIIPALALLQIAAGRNTQGVAGGQSVKDCFNIMQNFPSRSDVPDTLYLHCLLLVEIRNPRIDIQSLLVLIRNLINPAAHHRRAPGLLKIRGQKAAVLGTTED